MKVRIHTMPNVGTLHAVLSDVIEYLRSNGINAWAEQLDTAGNVVLHWSKPCK